MFKSPPPDDPKDIQNNRFRLRFEKNAILMIEDTLPNQNLTGDQWLAWSLDEQGNKIKMGKIPSKIKFVF